MITIDDRAQAKVMEILADEADAADLALGIRVSGVNGNRFTYEMSMVRRDGYHPDDHVEEHGALSVVIPPDSVDKLRGATLELSRDLLNPGMVLNNPNTPSPAMAPSGPPPDVSGPVAQRVQQVLDSQINPAIASHGGFAELVAVEESTAYLRLGGGCQGCGLASVTLSQGIEKAILGAVPDITSVMDVTDHASGTNPYYESSKK